MFITGHTGFGFLFAQVTGLSLDASIIYAASSNLNDIMPLAIDGKGKWNGLYQTLHKPTSLNVRHLWAFILMFVVYSFLGFHYFLDYVTHKKEGGRNWAYWVLDQLFFLGALTYCYLKYWS